jgi:hypothetical protein
MDRDASRDLHWTHLHTVALAAITGLFVWMAIWRPWGLYTSWIAVMIFLALFVVIAGHGITGVWRGAFIDSRNKMSLSRLQMFTWTVLIVSAFGCIAIARTLESPVDALDIAVPATIWLLMGISTSSLIGSPLIKDAKQRAPTPGDASETLRRQGLTLKQGDEPQPRPGLESAAPPESRSREVRVEGRIVSNVDPRQARWSDLFTSEELSTVTYLDLGKVQLFFFTVLVVLSYGVAIGSSLRGAGVPTSLPDVGDGMVTLLGISHAGYLSAKAVSGGGPGGQPSR